MPPVIGKGPNDLWPDYCQGGLATSVISITIYLLQPMKRPGQDLVEEGKLLSKIEMKEPLESKGFVQWLIFFCTVLRTDLSLAFQIVASRISTCQGTEEKPQQMVRPLGVISGSWRQKQSNSASLSAPKLSNRVQHCQDWALAIRDLGSLVLRLLNLRNWKWP